MDPNTALETCRASARLVGEAAADGDIGTLTEEAQQLAESFSALDAWLRRGGFLPGAWARAEPFRRTHALQPAAKMDAPHRQQCSCGATFVNPEDAAKHIANPGER